MRYVIPLLILTVVMLSCKTTTPVSVEDYDKGVITISSGGGFAGRYTTYKVLDNGEVYKKNMDTFLLVGNLKKAETTQIFRNYDMLRLDEVDVQKFGNVTYGIIYTEGDKKHKISWATKDESTQKCSAYYKSIMGIIKSHKFPPPETTKEVKKK